ncbi:hypothetical protein WMF31_37705 [Sorangium sp. So ce1036]|uniref:hypothetical protein n=1 Tax=Sorangium sp. So ce1036 TaxID=3133328 RepID=UPI003F0823A4
MSKQLPPAALVVLHAVTAPGAVATVEEGAASTASSSEDIKERLAAFAAMAAPANAGGRTRELAASGCAGLVTVSTQSQG